MSDEQKNELGTIKNREDILLAKIAGYDVDITTMTPPVLNGVREKILDEIAKRVTAIEQGGGGGGSVEPLIVNATETGIDATYNEIKAAVLAGKTVWLYLTDADSNVMYESLIGLGVDTGAYFCAFANGYNTSSYGSEDADTDMSSPGGGGGGADVGL